MAFSDHVYVEQAGQERSERSVLDDRRSLRSTIGTRGSEDAEPVQLYVHMEAALCLLAACPAALAPAAWQGARRAADRGVALVVQRVVGQPALVDAPPQVLLAPQHQRVVLLDAPGGVRFDRLRVRSRRTLLAADGRDPRLRAL